ncbi:MAG: transporter substrate-binding domain-containing protein [Alphaproteobacteria bacterium]|nr:transporter substrate-binding domain-containing protein [Alphaproteobacteria bacterium]
MQRILALLFFLLTASLPVFAGPVFDNVVKTGVLRCAFTSVDPYIYKDLADGKVRGPVADILEKATAQIDLKVEWVAEVGYADFADGFKTGRYDALCSMLSFAPQRARVTRFTDPIFYLPFYAYGRTTETRFKQMDDLNSDALKAAVTDGEVFERMTRERFPLTPHQSHPNMTLQGQLFLDVADSKADYVVHDAQIFKQFALKNPDRIKPLFSEPVHIVPVGWALPLGEDDLANLINASLRTMHDLDLVDKILDKYKMTEKEVLRINKNYTIPE